MSSLLDVARSLLVDGFERANDVLSTTKPLLVARVIINGRTSILYLYDGNHAIQAQLMKGVLANVPTEALPLHGRRLRILRGRVESRTTSGKTIFSLHIEAIRVLPGGRIFRPLDCELVDLIEHPSVRHLLMPTLKERALSDVSSNETLVTAESIRTISIDGGEMVRLLPAITFAAMTDTSLPLNISTRCIEHVDLSHRNCCKTQMDRNNSNSSSSGTVQDVADKTSTQTVSTPTTSTSDVDYKPGLDITHNRFRSSRRGCGRRRVAAREKTVKHLKGSNEDPSSNPKHQRGTSESCQKRNREMKRSERLKKMKVDHITAVNDDEPETPEDPRSSRRKASNLVPLTELLRNEKKSAQYKAMEDANNLVTVQKEAGMADRYAPPSPEEHFLEQGCAGENDNLSDSNQMLGDAGRVYNARVRARVSHYQSSTRRTRQKSNERSSRRTKHCHIMPHANLTKSQGKNFRFLEREFEQEHGEEDVSPAKNDSDEDGKKQRQLVTVSKPEIEEKNGLSGSSSPGEELRRTLQKQNKKKRTEGTSEEIHREQKLDSGSTRRTHKVQPALTKKGRMLEADMHAAEFLQQSRKKLSRRRVIVETTSSEERNDNTSSYHSSKNKNSESLKNQTRNIHIQKAREAHNKHIKTGMRNENCVNNVTVGKSEAKKLGNDGDGVLKNKSKSAVVHDTSSSSSSCSNGRLTDFVFKDNVRYPSS